MGALYLIIRRTNLAVIGRVAHVARALLLVYLARVVHDGVVRINALEEAIERRSTLAQRCLGRDVLKDVLNQGNTMRLHSELQIHGNTGDSTEFRLFSTEGRTGQIAKRHNFAVHLFAPMQPLTIHDI